MHSGDEHLELDAELAALDRQLADALHAQPPAHLADRIVVATADGLHQRLEAALKVATPDGLPQRVYDASAPMLASGRGPVVGRIGMGSGAAWFRFAVAASLALLIGGAIYMQSIPGKTDTADGIATIEDRLRRIELAMSSPADEMETQLAALTLDVEQAAWDVRVDSTADIFDMPTNAISDDIDLLEAEMNR